MEFKEREFVPVLFGGDINTYSVARAFMKNIKSNLGAGKVYVRTELL